MTRRVLSIFVTMAVLSIAVSAAAVDPPFTKVNSVCETCEQPKADVVTMNDGQKLRGKVVGENASFYTFVRYTEVRVLPRDQVKSIEWANGSQPSGVRNKDQLLLKNGVVFSGSIIDDKQKPALFQLRSDHNNFTYIVFKSEVQEAYKNGQKYDFN